MLCIDVLLKLCYTHGRLMQDKSDKDNLVYGTVEEALPNALFRVMLDGQEKSTLAYLAGKMRKFKIRVLVGDRVGVVPEPYGGKARIAKRI
jgi:translation initiation factor IF-1